MKIVLRCFLLITFFSYKAFCQSKFSSHSPQVQLEALGPGSLFSLNFDSRFGAKEKGFGFRIGLGGSPLGALGKSCNSGGLMALPAAVNYLIGKRDHYAEVGAGSTLVAIGSTKIYCVGFDHDFFSDETESFFFLTAGYRYQPFKRKGFTYRIFISPLFQNNFPVKFWGGVSLGRRF
jgi:hypothetical protein